MSKAAADNRVLTHFEDEGSHKFRTEIPNIIDEIGLDVYAHRLYAHIKRRAGEGDGGECTSGLRGMAKTCGMSVGKAAQARQELLDLGLIRCREVVRDGKGGGRYDVLTVADIWDANRTFSERVKRKLFKPFESEQERADAARMHVVCLLLERGHDVVMRRPSPKETERGAQLTFWKLAEAQDYLSSYLSDGGVSPHEHPSGGVSPRERGRSPRDTPGVSPREHKKEPFGRKNPQELTPRASAREAASPQSGVGELNRRPGLQDFRAYFSALSRTSAGSWIKDVEAVARARWKDGTADAEVKAYLSDGLPGAGEPAAPAPRTGPSLSSAKQRLYSILSASSVQADGRAVIEGSQFDDCSDETRAALLAALPEIGRKVTAATVATPSSTPAAAPNVHQFPQGGALR